MKKIGTFILCAIMSLLLPISVVSAAPDSTLSVTPTYDASFDNNKGALYANGTPITISADGAQTEVSWEGGNVIVPSSVRVFGGGVAGTSYENSSITMLGGSVKNIYGGGFSVDETLPADVNEAHITVVDGTVTAGVYGGGLLYSEVNNATVIVQNGEIQAVLGGGAASATIGGVSYSSGTEEHPELSGTRVNSTVVTLNGGIFDSVWGGGQGYSYTNESTLIITGGTINYVTAGGSNGITKSIYVEISGGTIQVYQSVNRGIVKEVETTMTGGVVTTFYVGGEVAADVTGTIDEANIVIISGEVANLRAGTSNSLPLDITQSEYEVSFVTGTVANNEITEGTESFTYTISFEKSKYRIPQRTPYDLKMVVTTNPTGFESLINQDQITFLSSDDTIAMVNSEGTVIGLKDGTVSIGAILFDHSASTTLTVNGLPINMVLEAIFMVILGIVLIALLAVFFILKTIFNLLFRRNII